MAKRSAKITSSSTAEYFSKNLQQVGFSSGTKAVLTTLKEAVDNSLDACEEAGILPDIDIEIEKMGEGAQKNWDLIRIKVTDNGPGIHPDDIPRVYGEYLASSKFGRGRCSRGQQGIGISAATTWAQLTATKGVNIISKTAKMRQAIKGVAEVDIKNNKGIFKKSSSDSWDRAHGVSVEFFFDGRLQLNGDGGVLTYLTGTSLVNPHLKLSYKINEEKPVILDRVDNHNITIPPAINPHPHTMKLGEFVSHANLFGKVSLSKFLKTGFSRVADGSLREFVKEGLSKAWLKKPVNSLSPADLKKVYQAVQTAKLLAPSTKSVLSVGEVGLSNSIKRLGEIDFFSVVSRKPKICDAKPVVVEVAIARFLNKAGLEEDKQAQVLRFANRVPLQFDKASCAIVKGIESVNWKSYGLTQTKKSIPNGPYIIAVSVVSPFIKFKNASKETIDSSNDLVEEIRLALMQAGQRLSRHIKREKKAEDLENKIRHIEQFGPILIQTIGRITKAPKARLTKAEKGLMKILGRDSEEAESELKQAIAKQEEQAKKVKEKLAREQEKKAKAAASGPKKKRKSEARQ